MNRADEQAIKTLLRDWGIAKRTAWEPHLGTKPPAFASMMAKSTGLTINHDYMDDLLTCMKKFEKEDRRAYSFAFAHYEREYSPQAIAKMANCSASTISRQLKKCCLYVHANFYAAYNLNIGIRYEMLYRSLY